MKTFAVPGPPVPKQRPRKGAGGVFYTPAKTQRFEQSVGLAARCAGVRSTSDRLRVEIVAFMPDKRTRDLDNVAKSVCDGLNGIAWADDEQVDELIVRRELDRESPRTEITIEYLEVPE